MKTFSKGKIIFEIQEAFNKRESLEEEYALKDTNFSVSVKIIFGEKETFIDKEGREWVRA